MTGEPFGFYLPQRPPLLRKLSSSGPPDNGLPSRNRWAYLSLGAPDLQSPKPPNTTLGTDLTHGAELDTPPWAQRGNPPETRGEGQVSPAPASPPKWREEKGRETWSGRRHGKCAASLPVGPGEVSLKSRASGGPRRTDQSGAQTGKTRAPRSPSPRYGPHSASAPLTKLPHGNNPPGNCNGNSTLKLDYSTPIRLLTPLAEPSDAEWETPPMLGNRWPCIKQNAMALGDRPSFSRCRD